MAHRSSTKFAHLSLAFASMPGASAWAQQDLSGGLPSSNLITHDYMLNENSGGNWLWSCEYVDELPGRVQGVVPSYMPGENPFLHEFADKYKIALEAALGGAETMYPEYKKKLGAK